jgi:hypothetical protein
VRFVVCITADDALRQQEGKVGRQTERNNALLDRWAAGDSCRTIAGFFNLTPSGVCGIVGYARRKGDLRAAPRRKRGNAVFIENGKANRGGALKRYRLKKLADRFPVSSAELSAIAAAATVPVTHLGLGAHLGWRPQWLR